MRPLGGSLIQKNLFNLYQFWVTGITHRIPLTAERTKLFPHTALKSQRRRGHHYNINVLYFLILGSLTIVLIGAVVFCYTHEIGPFGCGFYAQNVDGQCIYNDCRCENGWEQEFCEFEMLDSCSSCYPGFELYHDNNEVACVDLDLNGRSNDTESRLVVE